MHSHYQFPRISVAGNVICYPGRKTMKNVKILYNLFNLRNVLLRVHVSYPVYIEVRKNVLKSTLHLPLNLTRRCIIGAPFHICSLITHDSRA